MHTYIIFLNKNIRGRFHYGMRYIHKPGRYPAKNERTQESRRPTATFRIISVQCTEDAQKFNIYITYKYARTAYICMYV